jgi:hypothetical protein
LSPEGRIRVIDEGVEGGSGSAYLYGEAMRGKRAGKRASCGGVCFVRRQRRGDGVTSL